MIEKIEIQNYRSIIGQSATDRAAETELSVDDDITTLIGKNEAGKSNLLNAINRFHDKKPLLKDDLSNYGDYSGKSLGDVEILRCLLYSGVKGNRDDKTGVVRWLTGPYDRSSLADIPENHTLENISDGDGDFLEISSTITEGQPQIIRYASGDHKITFVPEDTDSQPSSQDGFTLPDQFPLQISTFLEKRQDEIALLCKWFIINVTDIDGVSEEVLGEQVDSFDKEPAENSSLERGRIQEHLEIISREFETSDFGASARGGAVDPGQSSISTNEIAKSAEELLSAFNRIHNTENPLEHLPTIVNQMEIDLADTQYHLLRDRGDPVLEGLLKLGRVKMERYDSFDSEDFRDNLDFAIQMLNDHLNSFWDFDSSRRDRRDELMEADQTRYEFTYELNNAVLRLSLSEEGEVDVPLGERSDGMRWIITFLLTIFAEPHSQSGGQRSVMLLDDPGIHLHPEAEKLLYRAFYYVVTEAQIIYTTHSPALVDQKEPDHLRIVEHGEDEDHLGTTVTNDIEAARDDESQIDVLSTAREALGWTLDDFLFQGKYTILVEGLSDKRYLQLFNQSFSFDDEKSYLEGDPTFVDSGGDRLPFLSRILSAEDVQHVILRDDDKAGEEKDERIENRTIYYREIFPDEFDYDVEVEDLIDTGLIIDKAESMYPEIIGEPDVREETESRNRPIMDLLDSKLPEGDTVDKGQLSKKVKDTLHEDLRENEGQFTQTTERFQKVIKKLIDESNSNE